MNWPTYENPNGYELPPPLIDYTRNRRHSDTRTVHLAAVDVWRDGVHLWRSYDAEGATHAAAWALDHYGPDAPNSHNGGVWRIAGGLTVQEWCIPTPEQMAPCGSMNDVRNLVCAMFAIGQQPHAPDIDIVPPVTTFSGRLNRSTMGFATWTGESMGVSVRIAYGRTTKIDEAGGAVGQYLATLERRETRAGAGRAEFTPGQHLFTAGQSAPPNTLAAIAKRALGLTGWPMTRKPGTTEWTVAKAPFTLKIDRLDG